MADLSTFETEYEDIISDIEGKKEMSHLMTKTNWSVCPEKTQFSLGICPLSG